MRSSEGMMGVVFLAVIVLGGFIVRLAGGGVSFGLPRAERLVPREFPDLTRRARKRLDRLSSRFESLGFVRVDDFEHRPVGGQPCAIRTHTRLFIAPDRLGVAFVSATGVDLGVAVSLAFGIHSQAEERVVSTWTALRMVRRVLHNPKNSSRRIPSGDPSALLAAHEAHRAEVGGTLQPFDRVHLQAWYEDLISESRMSLVERELYEPREDGLLHPTRAEGLRQYLIGANPFFLESAPPTETLLRLVVSAALLALFVASPPGSSLLASDLALGCFLAVVAAASPLVFPSSHALSWIIVLIPASLLLRGMQFDAIPWAMGIVSNALVSPLIRRPAPVGLKGAAQRQGPGLLLWGLVALGLLVWMDGGGLFQLLMDVPAVMIEEAPMDPVDGSEVALALAEVDGSDMVLALAEGDSAEVEGVTYQLEDRALGLIDLTTTGAFAAGPFYQKDRSARVVARVPRGLYPARLRRATASGRVRAFIRVDIGAPKKPESWWATQVLPTGGMLALYDGAYRMGPEHLRSQGPLEDYATFPWPLDGRDYDALVVHLPKEVDTASAFVGFDAQGQPSTVIVGLR